MKSEWAGLSRQYQAALRTHLERSRPAGLHPARKLGQRAMAVELETLELARIHEQALIELVLPGYSPRVRAGMVRRAGAFFAEAITPIEKTHRTAQETATRLEQLNQVLRQRGADLAASNRSLQKEIARRKSVEEALKKSQQHYGRLLEHSHWMQERLRHLSHELLSAQEEERKKISRELHDVIAQTLATINARLATLKKEAGLNTQGLEQSIARTQRLVERSVSIVHRFARELRPAVLDDLGLIPALHTFMKAFQAQTGIRMHFKTFEIKIEQLDDDKRIVLYRVAQEALANVARHAQAVMAEVRIEKRDGVICMKIKDNGKGFQEERVLHARKSKRLGLLGMRERLEMVGGSFSVKSAPGKGTSVIAEIPVANGRARRRKTR